MASGKELEQQVKTFLFRIKQAKARDNLVAADFFAARAEETMFLAAKTYDAEGGFAKEEAMLRTWAKFAKSRSHTDKVAKFLPRIDALKKRRINMAKQAKNTLIRKVNIGKKRFYSPKPK